MPSMPVVLRLVRRLVLASLVAVVAPSARAQVPERFTNLQVLPDTISRAALIAQMRQFSFSIGVRCSYCHAVSDALDQPTEDFASDSKQTKLRAREMMRMVQDLNNIYLTKLPGRVRPTVDVQCSTCHGGVPRPEQLVDLLQRVTGEGGIDSALTRMDALRQRYYGTKAYDFGPRTLVTFGERLVADSRPRDAIVVFRRIVDSLPRSTEALLNLGAAYVAAGDTTEAVRSYQRVIEINPDAQAARVASQRISALRRQ
jgi:tetratricopeptide (TPR) repeat protein